MARGQKYSDEIKEKAYLMYATSGSFAEVSRELGIPKNTIMTWIRNKPPDEFEQLRSEKKKEFVERASDLIDKGLDLLEKRMELAMESDDELSRLKLSEISTSIGTLYDKRALAKGESTSDIKIEVKLPEGVKQYAQ